MNSLITTLIQFPFKFYYNILYYFNYIFFYFSIQSFPFISKEQMSYINIEEDNSFLQSENEYFLQSSEIESSNNTNIGGFSRDVDILRSSTTKNKSFIWNYCEKTSDGWTCVVKNPNGEPCNYFFSYNTNKGSTSNTISHLRKEHGIIREEVIKKVFHNII